MKIFLKLLGLLMFSFWLSGCGKKPEPPVKKTVEEIIMEREVEEKIEDENLEKFEEELDSFDEEINQL